MRLSVDEESVYSEDEEVMVSDMDVFGVSSADEDDDIQLCTCVGRAHARTCPFNPRNRGAAASKTDMVLSSTLNPPLAQELGLAVQSLGSDASTTKVYVRVPDLGSHDTSQIFPSHLAHTSYQVSQKFMVQP